MPSSTSTLVLCGLAASLPAVSACSCRGPLQLEDEIIDLYNSPRVTVFSARLSEPIHNYENSHQLLQMPTSGTHHFMPMTETFQNITVEVTHTFAGHGVLDQHLALPKSNAAERQFITTHTQTTCCLCGASFDHNAPVGSLFVLVLQQGSLLVSSCGISCLSTGDMLNYRNGQCNKTEELLKKFENTTERSIYLDQKKKQEVEPWLPVDPRAPRPTHNDSIVVINGKGDETDDEEERPRFSGLLSLAGGGVLCCVLWMCAYCAFRRCHRKEPQPVGYGQQERLQQYVALPCPAANWSNHDFPGPQPPQDQEVRIVEGIVVDPNPAPRVATEVNDEAPSGDVDEVDRVCEHRVPASQI